jgi:hypothetical protein
MAHNLNSHGSEELELLALKQKGHKKQYRDLLLDGNKDQVN